MPSKEMIDPIDDLIINLLMADNRESTNYGPYLHSVDWGAFIPRTIGHNLGPLIYKKLTQLNNRVDIPEEVLMGLEISFYESLTNNLRYQSELEKLVSLLGESGTDVIVLKGVALANTIYPNPALRPFSDIDVLIKEKDWRSIRVAFHELGYADVKKDFDRLPTRLTKSDMMDHLLAFRKDDLSFDIKLDLLELGVGMRESQGIWESAIPFNVGRTKALSLSPEYQLIHLCVHLNRHGFNRLIWFNDIVLLLQNKTFDWESVVNITKREGITPVIYHVLFYINQIFGNLVPENKLTVLRPSSIKTRIWNSLWPEEDIMGFSGGHELDLIFRKRFRPAELINNILLMGRPVDKTAYFIKKLLPPEDFLTEKYSDDGAHRSYLHYLIRRYQLLVQRRRQNV